MMEHDELVAEIVRLLKEAEKRASTVEQILEIVDRYTELNAIL